MAKTFRLFPNGIAAIFDEADGGGEITDITSLRNRPANDPESWLANIYFHSALNHMEVSSDDTVSVSHALIDAATGPGGEIPLNSNYDADGTTVDWDVKTHSLGYEPLVLVAVGSNLLMPGYPVQVPGTTNGSARFVSAYVTTTKVFLREFRVRGSATLAAQSIDYRIVVFRNMRAQSGNVLFDFDPDTGGVSMAKGTFDNSRKYLQVVPGGTPLGLALGRTMDGKNGAYRIIRPDATTFDPVPNTVKQGIYATGGTFSSDTLVYGSAMNYDGTYTGGGSVQVQAP